MSDKKAFIVRLEFEIAVLADNKDDAKAFMSDAVSTLMPSDIDDCCTVKTLDRFPEGWTEDNYVYHDGNRDITLKEACAQSKDYQRVLRQLTEYANRPQMDGHNA